MTAVLHTFTHRTYVLVPTLKTGHDGHEPNERQPAADNGRQEDGQCRTTGRDLVRLPEANHLQHKIPDAGDDATTERYDAPELSAHGIAYDPEGRFQAPLGTANDEKTQMEDPSGYEQTSQDKNRGYEKEKCHTGHLGPEIPKTGTPSSKIFSSHRGAFLS